MEANAVNAYVAPASPAQRRLWFLDRLTPGAATYNIPIAVRLRGALDVAALQRVLNRMVERHDCLRTTFGMEASVPVQIVRDSNDCDLRMKEVKEAELESALLHEARAPFDLAVGPLFRATLFRIGSLEHVLLLTLHHIVADGWSMGVLVSEFTELYRAFASNNTPRLAELPIQFADFVEWQEEVQQEPSAQSRFEEWRQHLQGAPQVLDLAADFQRPQEQSSRGAIVVRSLSQALTARVRELSLAKSVTPFMLLLTVFELLLARCSRQAEFLVGTPVAGRSHSDVEGLIGFFVNTLVLRADVEGNPSFADLLSRVKHECLAAFAHEDVAFDRLVDALQFGRDLSRPPLFQTYFVFESARPATFEVSGLQVSLLEFAAATAKVDLTLTVEDSPAAMVLRWEYCTDLFRPETVARWAQMFETLCAAAVELPHRAVSELPLLTAAEQVAMVKLGLAAAEPCQVKETLHAWFTRVAKANPDRVAITDGANTVSYAELDAASDRLAHRLRQLGAGPETLIAVCLPRSRNVLVAILAVLKSGAAYVPVDPTYPKSRIDFILADSKVAAVITESSQQEFSGVPVVDVSHQAMEGEELIAPEDKATADNGAYVIYTSGSTGQPKGCVVTHANVVRLMLATEHWFSFGAEDVWTLFHSFAFDFSVWEIWGALLYGGRLVVVPFEVSRSPEAFHRLLEAEYVSVLNQTPSAFRQLIAADAQSGRRLSLRAVIFGGEALDVAALAPWMERYGDASPQLINMYGITETTVHVTYRRILRADLATANHSVIGVPIPDLAVHLLDEHLVPVPFGVPGEIVVGGAGLARGYLGQPELTSQRFVSNPYGEGRLYRSGDLARRSPDGGLEYLGRLDEQVKIRGFRIELGEIERVLGKVPGVKEVAVIARPDQSGGKRLVAYLSGLEEGAAIGAAAREACHTWLPDYMVPSAFVALPALPLTSHGKLDRRALPEPSFDAPSAATYIAPVSFAELTLAGIWGRVLGLGQVGLEDNFFELGGDSILTIQVVSQARKAGLQLAPKDLFEQRTLRDLAAVASPLEAVAAAGDFPAGDGKLAGVGGHAEDVYATTPMQAGMLFHCMLEPERDVYFEQVSGDVRGRLQTAAFRSAWQGLMDRHPAMRTSFQWREDGEPLQIVNREAALCWQEEDYSGLDSTEQAALWEQLLAKDRGRGFVLNEAPLWRVTLVRLAEDHYRWLWSHFHGLLDGWCLPLVFQDVLRDYEYLASGIGSRPPAGFAYRPYVEWLAARNKADAESYWRNSLAGFEAAGNLLLTTPAVGNEARDGDFEICFEATESARIREWARTNQLTLNTLFQGAWALLLSRYGMGEDVVFGTTVAGRPTDLPNAENTIGLFINTLPLRVEVESVAAPAEWLRKLQQAQAKMREFEFSSLADVQGWSELPQGQPLFETILVFENYPGDELLRAMPSSLRLENLRTAERTNYLLTAAVVPAERITLKLHFDARRLAAEPVKRMLAGWQRLLRGLIAAGGACLANLELSSEAERAELLTWSSNARLKVTTNELCVHALIEAVALQAPDAPALLATGRSVSYREMMTRAAALACELKRRGVQAEARVAVCMEKSPEMVIAWMATLMTGAAFLPLDPQFASARLAKVVANGEACLLLVDEKTFHLSSAIPLDVLRADAAFTGCAEVFQGPAQTLAYIIHTSGSTGEPKGVMLSHAGLNNLALTQAAITGLGPGMRGLQFASVSFDAAISEVFMSLLSGAAIFLEERDQVPNPAELAALVRRENLDNATLPPALLQALSPHDFPTLQTLLIAGEAASEEMFRAWAQGGRRVFNAYGPTEVTVCATMEEVDKEKQPVSLGYPIANLTVYVVDQQWNLVPAGVAGEILVGGVGVARGYLNCPELTAERFIPDAFGKSGGRLYRTGDLGRWMPDGRLEFLGRADQQVKIRGFRVEPGEVEAALQTHPAVSAAVVLARKDVAGSYLAAFAVAVETMNAAVLLEYLRGILPGYLVPRSVTVLQAWPLTPAGKIDRRALVEAVKSEAEVTAFANAKERQIANIWAGALRLEAVNPDDNFFELGGDSILSLQIVARANSAGIVLTPRQIFKYPTVRLLAEVAEWRSRGATELAAETGAISLTPIQHWFFNQEHAEPHHWNQALLLEIRNAQFVAVIRQALAAVIHHHDGFRLRFHQEDGEWQQAYAESAPAMAGQEIERYSASQMSEVVRQLQSSLNLTEGPLWRAAVFDGEAPLLFVAIHHLVVDGVSWRILAEDLAMACQQLSLGVAVSLPQPTATFGQWSRSLRAEADTEQRSAESAYWLKLQAANNELPVDAKQPQSIANEAGGASVVSVELDEEATAQLLREANAAYRLQANEFLLAALARTLGQWSGRANHLVSIEGHGREEFSGGVDVSRTVGWFTSIFPFQLDASADGSDARLLTGIKEQLRAVPAKGMGFGVLRYLSSDAALRHELAAIPQPRISFNYLGQTDQTLGPDAPFALSAKKIEFGQSLMAKRVHWIDVNAMISGGRLQVDWIYCGALHQRATVERIAGMFLANVRSLTAHCLSPTAGAYTASDFQLADLSAAELDALFEDLSGPMNEEEDHA